jgi:MFS family permease
MIGRFVWSSSSDLIGRRATYACFFTLGPILYLLLPLSGTVGSVAMFIACAAFMLSTYGGGFATIPAYLSDIFGTQHVGAIHGRLLTAWAAAGVAGPVLVNSLRQAQVDAGVPVASAYNTVLYLMAGLLMIGFVCNLFVRRVDDRYAMSPSELQAERGHKNAETPSAMVERGFQPSKAFVVTAWLAVSIPLLWGVWQTTMKASALFVG